MKAMILAAGHGIRMKPLTDHLPKPLLKVGGKSLLQWHIEKLKTSGITNFVINLAWQGHKIPEALGDGEQLGVNIQYSDEQGSGALETAGGILKALPLLGNDTFAVVNGDIWCDYIVDKQFQLETDKLVHCILVNNPSHNPDGDFGFIAADSSLLSDQPESGDKFTFSGIAYYHPDFFATLEPGKQALAPLLKQAMSRQQVSGEIYRGDWRDIGTPQRLKQLDEELSRI